MLMNDLAPTIVIVAASAFFLLGCILVIIAIIETIIKWDIQNNFVGLNGQPISLIYSSPIGRTIKDLYFDITDNTAYCTNLLKLISHVYIKKDTKHIFRKSKHPELLI